MSTKIVWLLARVYRDESTLRATPILMTLGCARMIMLTPKRVNVDVRLNSRGAATDSSPG